MSRPHQQARRPNHPTGLLTCVAMSIVVVGLVLTGPSAADPSAPARELISFWRGGPGTPSIWVMRADGSGRREIRGLPEPAKRGELSPSGTQIVFDGAPRVGDRFAFDIYIARADGTSVRRLTHGSDRDTGPHWSPDGRTIVFQRSRGEGQPPSIWVIGADGRGLAHVTDGSAPIWSVDGRRLAFARATPLSGTSSDDIYVCDLSGGRVRRVFGTRDDDFPAAWSPDGVRILFTRVSRSGPRSQVFVVGADGRRSVAVTSPQRGVRDLAAEWSPDGRRILFTRVKDRALSEQGQVFVVSSNGHGPRNLSRNGADEYATSWRRVRD